MSKYEPLWEYVKQGGKAEYRLSFEEIEEIAGVSVDHSFLRFKSELAAYGYEVGKISLKERTILFRKTE